MVTEFYGVHGISVRQDRATCMCVLIKCVFKGALKWKSIFCIYLGMVLKESSVHESDTL